MKKLILGALLVLSAFLIVACQAPVEEAEMPAEVMEDAEMPSEEMPESEEMDYEGEMMEDAMVEEDAEAPLVYAAEGDIQILAHEGFNVEAYTLKVGESVTFVNMNTADDPIKRVVLTFQPEDNPRKFDTSPKFDIGETYTHTFTQAGNYDVWTVGYGVKLPITVTE